MNKIAKEIGLKRTTFFNPHGLNDPRNKSSVIDLGLLTATALKWDLFKKIVKTKKY